MSALGDNLRQLILREKLNVTELARLTNTLQPVLHRMVNGETANPRIDTLLPLAKYFNISIDQLVGAAPLPANQTSNVEVNAIQPRYVKLLNWSTLLSNTTEEATSEIWVETTEPLSEKSFALRVKDSTMQPLFNEDAILLIDPTVQPKNKDYVVVAIENSPEPTFRQIFFDGTDVYLKPLNPEFKTIFLDKNAKYQFLGVVIEVKMILKPLSK